MPVFNRTRELIRNMGLRYVAFRVVYESLLRSGLFKKKFPQNPEPKQMISLEQWKKQQSYFFTDRKIHFAVTEPMELLSAFNNLKAGKVSFFNAELADLGTTYDWITNPENGYRYPSAAHWATIKDYDHASGDIKYVWEKSRFSFLYIIIRHDIYSSEDNSQWVWDEILSWIKSNPINSGPNYRCSQEIALRVINWTFALNFYRNYPSLTEEIFQKIMHAVYWQMKHVYSNINFSRIAVRNNHALTETFALYFGGLFFPFFREADKWKKDGKRWFEQEIAYQVYNDGTFLQFSMNYHRVVVQLLTWAIRLSEINNDRFSEIVYDRARKSLGFLLNSMDINSGWLPNYGANDGALFFKLNSSHYRDYRPQLEALSFVLGSEWIYGNFEDKNWYGLSENNTVEKLTLNYGYSNFDIGGYYLYRTPDTFSFIRCGNHKDRPSQADNLHIDIWYKGLNVLHDAGSYKYNTSPDQLKYFMGTQSHNTVMLDDFDQMEKGARFIWYFWTQCESINTEETDQYFLFEGTISAFKYINGNIRHTRRVLIHKTSAVWEIDDTISNKPESLNLKQIWHTCYPERLKFTSITASQEIIQPIISDGYYSEFYGKKEKCTELTFSTIENHLKTIITIN